MLVIFLKYLLILLDIQWFCVNHYFFELILVEPMGAYELRTVILPWNDILAANHHIK